MEAWFPVGQAHEAEPIRGSGEGTLGEVTLNLGPE